MHIPKDDYDSVRENGVAVTIRPRLVVRCEALMPKVYGLSLYGVWFPPLTC